MTDAETDKAVTPKKGIKEMKKIKIKPRNKSEKVRTAINEKAPPRQDCYGCTKKHLTKKELYKKAIDKFL